MMHCPLLLDAWKGMTGMYIICNQVEVKAGRLLRKALRQENLLCSTRLTQQQAEKTIENSIMPVGFKQRLKACQLTCDAARQAEHATVSQTASLARWWYHWYLQICRTCKSQSKLLPAFCSTISFGQLSIVRSNQAAVLKLACL